VGTASTLMRHGEGTSRRDVARETGARAERDTCIVAAQLLPPRASSEEAGACSGGGDAEEGDEERKNRGQDATRRSCLVVHCMYISAHGSPPRRSRGCSRDPRPACSNAFSSRDPASLPGLPSPFVRCAVRPPPSRRLPAATVIPFAYCLARRPGLNVHNPNARAPRVSPAPIDLALGVLRRMRCVSLLTRNACAARERHPHRRRACSHHSIGANRSPSPVSLSPPPDVPSAPHRPRPPPALRPRSARPSRLGTDIALALTGTPSSAGRAGVERSMYEGVGAATGAGEGGGDDLRASGAGSASGGGGGHIGTLVSSRRTSGSPYLGARRWGYARPWGWG
jgi:hypothetical protein